MLLTTVERIASVRRKLLDVQPPSIAACEFELSQLRRGFEPDPPSRDEVLQELARTRLLLEQAHKYHSEWLQTVAGLSAGYTADGCLDAAKPAISVSIQA